MKGGGAIVQMASDNVYKLDIGRMMKKYGNQVLRICYIYLKDYNLSEDATQETFIKVYNKYYLFNGKSSEITWITKIAINICNDYLRTAWLRKIVIGISHNNEQFAYNAESKNIESQVYTSESNRELLVHSSFVSVFILLMTMVLEYLPSRKAFLEYSITPFLYSSLPITSLVLFIPIPFYFINTIINI